MPDHPIQEPWLRRGSAGGDGGDGGGSGGGSGGVGGAGGDDGGGGHGGDNGGDDGSGGPAGGAGGAARKSGTESKSPYSYAVVPHARAPLTADSASPPMKEAKVKSAGAGADATPLSTPISATASAIATER